jgi:CRP-like cAMP-binding protein
MPSLPCTSSSGGFRPTVSTESDSKAEVRTLALFAGIPASDCASILASANEKYFRRRENLFAEGDSIFKVLLLTSGVVKLSQVGANGTEVILRLVRAGEIVGTFGPCLRGYYNATAQALQPCRALVWEASVFENLQQSFPALQRNLLHILGARLQELELRFREVATEKVAPRVANQLLRLLPQIGRRIDGTVELALSQEELAQMTGTTLFTISRLFSKWSEFGVVQPRREAVVVLNIQRLLELSLKDGTSLDPRELAQQQRHGPHAA